MTYTPGDFLEYGKKKEVVQVVWVGSLNILRYGHVEEMEAMCLYCVKQGKYKVVMLKEDQYPYEDQYAYAKDLIGKDGL